MRSVQRGPGAAKWLRHLVTRLGILPLVAEEPEIHVARFNELEPRQLYGILRLRSDVFIVEQQCAYDDVDGLDTEPHTRQLWMEQDGEVIATLRILSGPGYVPHIGRVVTHASHRGRGHGARLMRAAIDITGTPVEIKAQSRLAGWYAQFGFAPYGDEFDEYGILHQPMRLGALATTPR